MTKKQTRKELERRVEVAYKKHFDRVQVNMMDLNAIHKAGEACVKSNGDLDVCMVELVIKYRRN